MKWIGLMVCFYCVAASAQFRDRKATMSYQIALPAVPTLASLPFGLKEDPMQNVRFSSPTLYTLPVPDSQHQFQTQWISSISSLSFNNGKFGSYYYWDVRGNLVDTRGFIDIAGKNKRGLKLVFPWR